jgi:PAS domain-containing protein
VSLALEERLKESEERFRILIDQATDGIFIADASGRYQDVNPAGCEMLGYTLEEMLRLSRPGSTPSNRQRPPGDRPSSRSRRSSPAATEAFATSRYTWGALAIARSSSSAT